MKLNENNGPYTSPAANVVEIALESAVLVCSTYDNARPSMSNGDSSLENFGKGEDIF